MTNGKARHYYTTQETHDQLIAIGRDHGAQKGREASPGIRVAARYHGRLVEALEECCAILEYEHAESEEAKDARLLLREIEAAK